MLKNGPGPHTAFLDIGADEFLQHRIDAAQRKTLPLVSLRDRPHCCEESNVAPSTLIILMGTHEPVSLSAGGWVGLEKLRARLEASCGVGYLPAHADADRVT